MKSIASLLVLRSKNTKVGNVAATYAPIKSTCDRACPFFDNGCYAQQGKVGMHLRDNVEPVYAGLDGDTLAELESAAIRDGAAYLRRRGIRRPLRMHVSGDATTNKRAAVLASAASHWPGHVWTYTHAHRTVDRSAWGGVSVLASCESLDDAKAAMARGYAAAVVTGPHPADGKAYTKDGVKVIPCPAQTREDVTCEKCRLCWNDRALVARNAAIAFEAHGPAKKRALTVIR